MKKLNVQWIFLALIAVFGFATSVSAAPSTQYLPNVVILATTTSGCATFSSAGILYSTGVACGTGSGGGGNSFGWPFTPTSWGNSTSSTIGFTNGIISNASSTFTVSPILATLSGLIYGNSGTLANVSTSSIGVTSPITFSGTLGSQVGGAGGNFGCATCVTTSRNINTTYPLGGGGALSGDLTLTFSGLATSSPWTQGQVAYVVNGNTLTSVATSSETCTSPLSCTAFNHVGSGGAITIQQASGAQNGYLGSADFLTFNNKIGTSSSATAGQLGYFTTTNGSPALLSGVSTSTLSASSPLTGSFIVIGSGGSVGCQTATGAQPGCLGSTDFTTFNVNRVATSASETQGQIAAFGTTNGSPAKLYSVATTSITCSGFITCTGFSGLTAASTITITGNLGVGNGGTGQNTFTAGQLLYGNGGAALSSVATTTLSAGTGLTGSFTVIQANGSTGSIALSTPVTEANGGTNSTALGANMLIANNGSNTLGSTSTPTAAAYLATSTTATSIFAGNFTINLQGKIGIGSSTPSALWGISVGTTTVIQAAQFVTAVASSTSQASSYTPNWDTGNTQKYILNQATSFIINATSSNPRDNGHYILKLCQDGTGSRTVTFVTPGQLRWTQGTTTISSAANTCTFIGMIYDATTQLYSVVASSTGIANK